jgi:alpha-glucosidase (family GH31 glycosyl hydrolase)
MFQGTPRMPWFWPDPKSQGYTPARFDETQRAFQAALNMRYTFLPFMYSLAHQAYRHGRPIGHPASFALPSACAAEPTSQQCIDAQNTYMVGSVLIPSDLGLAHTNKVVPTPTGNLPAKENTSTAILPTLEAGALWFRWNTTTTLAGGQTVKETLGLAEMAVFVRAGAVLPLQGGQWVHGKHGQGQGQGQGPIQHSAQAGGVLELQVYGGRDEEFEMVEDDGISLDYSNAREGAGDAATRTTMWRWDDALKTLTWSVKGGGGGTSPSSSSSSSTLSSSSSFASGKQFPNLYTEVDAVLFEAGAAEGAQRAARQTLGGVGVAGKVVFH